MTSVKRGFATGGNVSVHMPVPVPSLMLSAWNANVVSGTMVSDCIQAVNFTRNILDVLFMIFV